MLELRIEDGRILKEEVLPAIIVSVQPRYEESQVWYGTRAVEVLQGAFGDSGLRMCEACMVPRAFAGNGEMVYQAGPIGLDEVARLDDQNRGDSKAAKSAIWLDEHQGGVSIRIVDLGNARVIFAQNVDPNLYEDANSQRAYSLAEELERRHRGGSLTQAFVDVSIVPQQHISLDWTDQWGKRNHNLSGVTIALFDPVLGIGASHYQRTPAFNALVGGKVIMSVPTALARALGDQNFELFNPLITVVGVVRVPFTRRSNYGAVFTVSTNGSVGVGISLMNISLLPVVL